jgi:hypothetical protein
MEWLIDSIQHQRPLAWRADPKDARPHVSSFQLLFIGSISESLCQSLTSIR